MLTTERPHESVWSYPRPPRVEEIGRHAVVVFNGVIVASSRRVKRVLETSHPPTYYLPREDVHLEYMRPSAHRSFCEWKREAHYFDVVVDGKESANAAWTYPEPNGRFEELRDYIAFYPDRVDACLLDGELVRAQPGDYYGGWITKEIEGPFKGAP